MNLTIFAVMENEKMDDYIDRKTTIEAVHSAMYPYFCGAEDGDILSEDEKLVLSVNKTICTAIKVLPSADVQPVRHGKWIKAQRKGITSYGDGFAECDKCHEVSWLGWNDKYCRNCGADMRGDNDV